MFLKLLSVILLLCFLQAQAASFRSKSNQIIQSRIVGGHDANRGQFPYHVVLANRLSYFYFCGGTIITSRHILSAAHCVKEFEHNTNEFMVILNTSNLKDSDFTEIQISKAYVHPKYTKYSFQFDILILFTRREIQFNDFVQPIRLTTLDYTQTSGNDATITGWGALWEPKSPHDFEPKPKNLQFQRTTTLGAIDCLTLYKQLIGNIKNPYYPALLKDINQKIICTKTFVGSGMCIGDSGSGVVVNNTLVGIVSSSLFCAKGYPDIHTNVYPYLEWIETQVNRIPE